MKPKLFKIVLLTLFALVFLARFSRADQFIHLPAAIHISTIASDGKYSIGEIVKIAKDNGIKVIIFNEHDYVRFEYGLWPLRKVFKKTVQRNSLATYGIEAYLEEIERIQKENPDMVLIPGVESSPFYFWSGSIFKDRLTLHDWHRHLLVAGLNQASDYKGLPSIANNYALRLPFRLKNILYLWPVFPLILGALYLRVRLPRRYMLARMAIGIITIAISLLFLFNNFPFREFKYDQYHGQQGARPYQDFIDYVQEKGGLIFWAHPEAACFLERGKICIDTKKYPHILLDTFDYTGFSIFHEGYKTTGLPGGIWDEVLLQYCQDKRKSPVWAIAELDYDHSGNPIKRMQELRTIILVNALDKDEVLKALRKGKIYVSRNSRIFLNNFLVKDASSGKNATIGDQITLNDYPILKINGTYSGVKSGLIKIKLIRNGVVVKNFESKNPFEINYQDRYFVEGEKIYYRLEIFTPSGLLVTNPIFVKFKR